MRRPLHIAALCALLAAPACLAGQFAAKAMRPGPQTAADRELERKAQEFLDDFLRISPVFGTVNGWHGHDDAWDDYHPAAVDDAVGRLRQHRAAIAAIDRGGLSAGARVDQAIVLNAIDTAIFDRADLRRHEWDPTLYHELVGFGGLYLADTGVPAPVLRERLVALAWRMERLPQLLENARMNLKNAPGILVSFVIEQNPGNVEFYGTTVTPLLAREPDLTARLGAAQARAVAALTAWQEWLVRDLQPRATADWRLGADRWRKKFALALATDADPAAVYAAAAADLDRKRAAMLATALPLHAKYYPMHRHAEQGDALVNAVVGEVLDEVSRHHATPETLLNEARKGLQKIKRFIRERQIMTIPPDDDAFTVEHAPAFINGMAAAFFSPAPARSPGAKSALWISQYPREAAETVLREYNDCGLQSLLMHEAIPGHYAQSWHARRSPADSVWKSIFASQSFTEGWSVFAEEIMYEYGYAEGEPECLLVHQKINLRNAMNAMIDLAFHTRAMTDDGADAFAMDLLVKKGFQEEVEARGKIRRARLTAVQLSTYFVGREEIAAVMKAWQKRRGAEFNLREFMDAALSFGPVPPRELSRLMLDDD